MTINIDLKKFFKNLFASIFAISVVCAVGLFAHNLFKDYFPRQRSSDAFIYGLNEDNLEARAPYTSLPMFDCAWCHRTFKLNRHHIVPQSADPSKVHDLSNIIVLCRDCHFVLGHRCDWKKFNPDVQTITKTYTNCVVSKVYFETIVSNVNQKIEMQNREYNEEMAFPGTTITNFVTKDMQNLKIAREDFDTEEEWIDATNRIALISRGEIDDTEFIPLELNTNNEMRDVALPGPPTDEAISLDYVPPPVIFR